MRILSLGILVTLSFGLASCGVQDQLKSIPSAVANACSPGTMKPKLYQITGGTPENREPKFQLVAGFFDQNCEEKKVYLSACSVDGAKAMLGLLASKPLDLSNEEWNEFIQPGTGGYSLHPHLSCTSGTRVTPKWEPDHHPEVHIVSGKSGTSSMDVTRREDEGQVSRLHYVALHSCLGLRRQLGAEVYADPMDPSVQKPLQLVSGDDAIYLTCGKERPPQEAKEGWSLVKTLNGGGPIYIARYRPTADSPSQDLVIHRADGRDIFLIKDDSSELKSVQEAILKRLGLNAAAPVLLDDLDIGRDQIVYDLCLTSDCSRFTPQHQRLVAESVFDFKEADYKLKLHLLPNGLSLHALASSSADPSRVTAFARCSKETDPAVYLGLKRPEEPTDWWTKVKGTQAYQSLSYEEFPCFSRPSVCRIIIGDEDLSAKASTLYDGISSIMRRPITGACASASELEILVTGKPRVSGQPFMIGNLPPHIKQTNFDSIRIIGGPQSLITLDRSCTGCQAIQAPALVLTGAGRFSVENLAFRSLDDPTAAPSIAMKVLGSGAGKTEVAVKGLLIQKGTAVGEQPFATGILVLNSDVHLWNANAESYYQGLDAQGSRVSIFGATGGVEGSLHRTAMGTSHFKVLGPTAAAVYPGTSLKPLNSLRALRVADSALSIYGAVLDAPFGIDMSGTQALAFSEAEGRFNRFVNSGNSLGTRSSALYLKGYANVNLHWSEISDLGGLIEFDAQNFTAVTQGEFLNFHPGSAVKRKSRIIVNSERGLSQSIVNCEETRWDRIEEECPL